MSKTQTVTSPPREDEPAGTERIERGTDKLAKERNKDANGFRNMY